MVIDRRENRSKRDKTFHRIESVGENTIESSNDLEGNMKCARLDNAIS